MVSGYPLRFVHKRLSVHYFSTNTSYKAGIEGDVVDLIDLLTHPFYDFFNAPVVKTPTRLATSAD